MDASTVTIDWGTIIPVLAATFGPTITGFLQQFSKEWIAKAPWWAKGLISTFVSTAVGMIGAAALNGEAALGAVGGALVGSIGVINIALRKGTRSNLEASIAIKPPPPTP